VGATVRPFDGAQGRPEPVEGRVCYGAKVQRASRIIVIASTVLAGVAHGWLVVWEPYVAPAAIAAFVLAFLAARVSLTAALFPALLTIYVAPALLFSAFGISDYHLTLVWLALLAGPVLAQSDVNRWHIPGRWGVLFAAWALVIAMTWPIVAGREIDFSLIAAQTYDTRTAAYEGVPRAAAAWIAIVAFAQMLGVLWLDLLWARFSSLPRATSRGVHLRQFERAIVLPIVASIVLGGAAAVYQGLLDLEWMNLRIWSQLGRAGGLMLDANTLGIGAAMWAPISILLVWHKRLPMWVAAGIYVLLAAATWESGSRTALAALSAGTAGVIVAAAQRKGWWQPRMAQIVLLIGGALVVLAMVVAPREGRSPSPLQRVFDRLPRLEAGDLSRFANEMWTRFDYGTAAHLIIAEHPATGAGIGAFHVVFNDFLHRETGRTRAPDNAQNWWRHQLAELGVLGALPSLVISVLLVALIWRGGPYVEPVGSTTVLRMVLIGVGIASLLGVPTQHPASWISFATLMFWLLALSEDPSQAATPATDKRWWGAAIALAVVVAAGQAVTARGDLRVPARALWTGVPFKYGFSAPEGVSQHGELRWAARHAVEVLPVKGAWLELAIWAPGPDPPSPRLRRTSPSAEPPTVRVWRDRRRVIEQTIRTSEPLVYFLQAPEGSQWMMLEMDASRAEDTERALRVALGWLERVPPGAAPDRLIR
jgi:hypothetical protein